jgi:hypothetical protein
MIESRYYACVRELVLKIRESKADILDILNARGYQCFICKNAIAGDMKLVTIKKRIGKTETIDSYHLHLNCYENARRDIDK